MIRKISIIILLITISLYSSVFAKYVMNKDIEVADVDIVIKARYTITIYYIDIDTNSSMYTFIKRYDEGDTYEMECVEFDGYTYQYTDGEMTGIVDGNIDIFRYYKKN